MTEQEARALKVGDVLGWSDGINDRCTVVDTRSDGVRVRFGGTDYFIEFASGELDGYSVVYRTPINQYTSYVVHASALLELPADVLAQVYPHLREVLAHLVFTDADVINAVDAWSENEGIPLTDAERGELVDEVMSDDRSFEYAISVVNRILDDKVNDAARELELGHKDEEGRTQ